MPKPPFARFAFGREFSDAVEDHGRAAVREIPRCPFPLNPALA
jgi:hypothetical protein